jgi:DNA-binding MarR family transcriptional regulator/predicted GNAT family N-acyltransferase
MESKLEIKNDFWGELDLDGVITIASRLKRLSDLFYQQVQEVYDSRLRSFKTSWFSVLATIKREGVIDFKTLADKNNVSNSAISQVIRELENKELVDIKIGLDKRSRLISLTPKGDKILSSIIPDLIDIESVLKDILGRDGSFLIKVLDKTEYKLRKSSFFDMLEISIDKYNTKDKDSFRELNMEWINEYFGSCEDFDISFFERPEDFTFNKGGFILLAKQNDKVIGSIALIPESKTSLEIAKLTTHKDFRRRGIAQKLLDSAIIFTQANSYKQITAHSNTCLKEAQKFYEKNKFESKPYQDDRYNRVDVIYSKKI